MRTLCQRLKPQEELFSSIEKLLQVKQVKAGVLLSLVGSLEQVSLRFAASEEATIVNGPLEIVSVTGTVAQSGCHIHISVSDKSGKTTGGHLMPGSLVYTTVELVVLDLSSDHEFGREPCPLSGYDELVIKARDKSN